MDAKKVRELAAEMSDVEFKDVLRMGPDELRLLTEATLQLLKQSARLQKYAVLLSRRSSR